MAREQARKEEQLVFFNKKKEGNETKEPSVGDDHKTIGPTANTTNNYNSSGDEKDEDTLIDLLFDAFASIKATMKEAKESFDTMRDKKHRDAARSMKFSEAVYLEDPMLVIDHGASPATLPPPIPRSQCSASRLTNGSPNVHTTHGFVNNNNNGDDFEMVSVRRRRSFFEAVDLEDPNEVTSAMDREAESNPGPASPSSPSMMFHDPLIINHDFADSEDEDDAVVNSKSDADARQRSMSRRMLINSDAYDAM